MFENKIFIYKFDSGKNIEMQMRIKGPPSLQDLNGLSNVFFENLSLNLLVKS